MLGYYKYLSQEIGWSEVSLALTKIVFQGLLEREPFPITVTGIFHQDWTEGSWWNPGTNGSLSDRPGWRQGVLQHLRALSVVKANEKLSSVLLHKLAWGLLVLVHLSVLSTAKGRLISVSLADVLEVFEASASRQRKRFTDQSRALIIQDIIFMSRAKKTHKLYIMNRAWSNKWSNKWHSSRLKWPSQLGGCWVAWFMPLLVGGNPTVNKKWPTG